MARRFHLMPRLAASGGGPSSKKWNPGHYVRADAVAFLSSSSSVTARQAAYDLTIGNSNLKGGLIVVPWGSLETSEGVYDFTEIDRDLDYLSGLGKKLIIEPWYQKFSGSGADDDRYFPDYIYVGGGVASLGGYELHVDLTNPTWRDRFDAMYYALKNRYDSHPDVEQIIISETAAFTSSFTHYDTIIPYVASQWTQTCGAIYGNWAPTADMMKTLVELCDDNGFGIGAPDILPPKPIGPNGEDHGSRATRGVGSDSMYSDGTDFQDFGSTDHRGRIPISYSYEAIGSITPASFIDYITDTLRVTHMVWLASEGYSTDQNWSTGVLPTLIAAGYPIVTARPSQVP